MTPAIPAAMPIRRGRLDVARPSTDDLDTGDTAGVVATDGDTDGVADGTTGNKAGDEADAVGSLLTQPTPGYQT